MNQPKLSVIYPKGFLDKPLKSGRPDSKAFCEKWKTFRKPEQPLNIIEEIIPTTLEELILNFNKIINTYKANPDKYLAINEISKILTNEESVIKHALSKLDGTKGRCIISKTVTSVFRSYEYVSYNPNLKEIKKQLLILFNKFKYINDTNNTNDTHKTDIIIYEGHPLFIHLFAIVIDSFDVPEPEGKKKDCTDIFPMITLLALLLNKKYKTILEHKINNIPLPISTLQQTVEDNDSGDDDEWDKDDFELIKTIDIQEKISDIIIESIIVPKPEPIVENDKKKDENITEEIPDDWDNI
jgi:hypothetical protein